MVEAASNSNSTLKHSAYGGSAMPLLKGGRKSRRSNKRTKKSKSQKKGRSSTGKKRKGGSRKH